MEIPVTKIIDPKTEQEIEVLKIHIPNLKTPDHMKDLYINLKTGTIYSRNFMDTDWHIWIPIPFHKKLYDRISESNRDVKTRQEKRISLNEMTPEQKAVVFKRLGLI